MVQSKAKTVKEYLASLPPQKRRLIKIVRACVLKNLRKGFEENMNWGMISYEIPLEVFPKTYNKKPLMFGALAAQKNHNGLYLMHVYSNSKYAKILKQGYKKADIKLNMGKCCVRFKSLEEIHLPTIGKIVRSCSVKDFIEIYVKARRKTS